MKRILIVEDQPDASRFLKRRLATLDVVADEVTDGESAIRSCQERDYALIIVGLHGPAIPGLAFLQHLKYQGPQIPTIVLSSGSPMEDVATAFRYGASDWLDQKLISSAELLASVNHWVN